MYVCMCTTMYAGTRSGRWLTSMLPSVQHCSIESEAWATVAARKPWKLSVSASQADALQGCSGFTWCPALLFIRRALSTVSHVLVPKGVLMFVGKQVFAI